MYSVNDWVFSYGAGAQLNIQLTENAAVTLGYRYLLNDDATFSVLGADVELEDLDTHLFEIGLSIGWPL